MMKMKKFMPSLLAFTFLTGFFLPVSGAQENAAVLYRQSFDLLKEADPATDGQLRKFIKAEIEVTSGIKQYVESNKKAIELAVRASRMSNCDWGIDFSQGLELKLPKLNLFRTLANVMVAQAKILADEGDYKAALSYCVALKKVGQHLSDKVQITALVGCSVDNIANECIQDVFGRMPADLETLTQTKNNMVAMDASGLFKTCIDGEVEGVLADKTVIKKYNEKNKAHYRQYMANIKAAADLPYPEAAVKLEQLNEKDAAGNSAAMMTATLSPAFYKYYTIFIKSQSFSDAIRAALEVYIVKARTGRLPDELPEGLPKDVYSDKSFVYEKKLDGFVLRCRGMDLLKNEVYSYEFKVSQSPTLQKTTVEAVAETKSEAASEIPQPKLDKAVILDDVLALWGQGNETEAIEKFVRIDWQSDKVFSETSIFNLSQEDILLLPTEKGRQVRAQTRQAAKEFKKLIGEVLQQGKVFFVANNYDEAEERFDFVVNSGLRLSNPKSSALIRLIGQSVQRKGLRGLIALYTKTNNESKLNETKQMLDKLRKN